VNRSRAALLAVAVVCGSLLGAPGAQATSALGVRATVAASMTTTMPLLRLTFTSRVRASAMPRLVVRPVISTRWQQIGPRSIQAVVTGRVKPTARYVIDVPTTVRCAARCRVVAVRRAATGVAATLAWEQQLLATLHYLPVTFTPSQPLADPSQPAVGSFTWAYPRLPAELIAQWQPGQANVITTGALMAFQDVHHLATTGVADAATWNALLAAAEARALDPRPYDYVSVSEGSPENLTLYVAGRPAFHALVNTGISVAPTETGTYPVYLRYVNQVMTGYNPDGSYYADPVTWVSYFHGGDALHQFYRATYGWPQSLGCVEMTMSDAKHVWPYTPIGTLVTVTAS
jgi:L,D-transpeptidase catalytic domain/Putative peptidoglycan binding domain